MTDPLLGRGCICLVCLFNLFIGTRIDNRYLRRVNNAVKRAQAIFVRLFNRVVMGFGRCLECA